MNNKNGSGTQILLIIVVLSILAFFGYRITRFSLSLGPFLEVEMEKITPTPTEYFTFDVDIYIPPTEGMILLSTPEPASSASDAVYFYFSQVSVGNYEIGWDLLSETFKSNNNSTGFEPYKEYWSSVDQVLVTNTIILYDEGSKATVLTDLDYYYLDGRYIPVKGMKINLIYDFDRQVWIINSIEAS